MPDKVHTLKADIRQLKSTAFNTGFFIVMACCALGAIALIALLVGGEIKGARVGPDIQQKAKVD
jgi:hypothetical protein